MENQEKISTKNIFDLVDKYFTQSNTSTASIGTPYNVKLPIIANSSSTAIVTNAMSNILCERVDYLETLILEQRKEIKILTKAVEALLETKIKENNE